MSLDSLVKSVAREIEFTSVKLTYMTIMGEDGTVRVDGGPLPTTGYYVGGSVPSLVIRDKSDLRMEDVRTFVAAHSFIYYGVWTDTDTGAVYVDAVDHVLSEREAVKLGVSRAELAVWDIENVREIRTYNVTTGASK